MGVFLPLDLSQTSPHYQGSRTDQSLMKSLNKTGFLNIYYYMACLADSRSTVSPVEAHAFYDGQLIPARDRRLLLAGFCCKDSTQFKEPWYWFLDVYRKGHTAVTFFTAVTVHHDGRTVADCLCSRLQWVQNGYTCHCPTVTSEVY